jgi:cytoskeletal protein CcmA (bactofilin family)
MQPSDKEITPTESTEPSSTELETTTGSLETSDASLEQPLATPPDGSPTPPSPKKTPLKRLLARLNIYLLLFVLLFLVAVVVVVVAYVANRNSNKTDVQTQTLSADTLKQLAQSDVTVGQPKQTLNVQGNAVFSGKVLIRDSLEVAGPIRVGGSLSLPGITVSGNSIFDQVQISKGLSVTGDTALQGQLSVQKNISVGGGGTFGGNVSAPQLTVNTLQLNGNLNLTHHITAGGVTPGRSNGAALGSGGSASVSGSDTAGSININTGSGASGGCLVTITFAQRYNSTPHVLVSPVGSGAAASQYYVDRTTSSFSVCAITPPSNASFGFDYFVLD